jgi:CHAD domain-containing protein
MELRALERARRRFVEKPTDERLHAVRTTGRRFRSLLEDVECVAPARKLLKRVKRAAEITDAARNASVVLALLERSIETAERPAALELFASLEKRQDDALRAARRRLRRMSFAKR